jgi:hypothetical protein
MNTINTQMQNVGCCEENCSNTYKGEDQEIVNYYKCNQKNLTSADLWKIQSKRKQFTIGTTIIVK